LLHHAQIARHDHAFATELRKIRLARCLLNFYPSHKPLPTVKPYIPINTVPARALTLAIGVLLFCAAARSQPIVVANEGNDTVQVLGPDGSTTTYASGGLDQPMGVAFDANGSLYVSNFGDNTIIKFGAGGGGSQFDSMGLSEPKGLAFDANGNLFVANYGSSTVEEISPSGHATVFASAGVYQPYDVAFNPVTGDLFVSNNNGTIEKFNSSGRGMLFASGLDEPTGLTFDSRGNLYVANYWEDQIDEFSPSGHETVFANTGLGNNPIGLIFDSSGDLLVSTDNGLLEDFGPNAPVCSIVNTNQYTPWFFATTVPEPSSWSLVALGLGGFLGCQKLRARKAS
jgi:DNA-binding beta-propeller fold protein YncE